MEILGSTFDDSVFAEARDRVAATLPGYRAKQCEPEWFCEDAALHTDDSLEKQKVLKFRGDLAVRQEKYQAALDAYSSCLEWISDNNVTIRRDVVEAMARCCSRLGQKQRALELADMLSRDASNTSHLTSLLLLQVSIHQRFGAVAPLLASLQRLCSLLPFNPWIWFQLGQTSERLLGLGPCASQTSGAAEQRDGETEEDVDLDEDRTWLRACACFIRTRLLLTILQQQQSSFVRRRSDGVRRAADEALRRLRPEEATVQLLSQVMAEDLTPDRMREDYQDGESLASVALQSFGQRWWNKVLLSGVLETEAGRRHRRQDDAQR